MCSLNQLKFKLIHLQLMREAQNVMFKCSSLSAQLEEHSLKNGCETTVIGARLVKWHQALPSSDDLGAALCRVYSQRSLKSTVPRKRLLQ